MDCLLCDKCKSIIKPNENYHSVTIRGESYSLNDSNIKEFDVDMSEYRHYDICSSCYSKLEKLITKTWLVN